MIVIVQTLSAHLRHRNAGSDAKVSDMLDYTASTGLHASRHPHHVDPLALTTAPSAWASPIAFDAWAASVATAPRLSAQAEQQLGWQIVNEQCRVSVEQLLRANLYLVLQITRALIGRGVPIATLVGAGNQGLLEAVGDFDPSQGVRFSPAASWWIKHAVRCAAPGILIPSRLSA